MLQGSPAAQLSGFLSTLSLRRATTVGSGILSPFAHFYPRSPCGERRKCGKCQRPAWHISIHALLAESDVARVRMTGITNYFYPRSPCGERQSSAKSTPEEAYFYPRSPCGERPVISFQRAVRREFLSTLSLRRATIHHRTRRQSPSISIHALLAESDGMPSHGNGPCTGISIHALLAESDHYDNYNLHCVEISIHALLAESDVAGGFFIIHATVFLSTLSLRRAT